MESTPQDAISKLFRFLRAWVFKAMVSSRNGTPDLIACLPITREEALKLFETQDTIGLFVAVEVKDVNKKEQGRKLQEVQLRKIREAGGIGLVANNTGTVKDELARFKINGQ